MKIKMRPRQRPGTASGVCFMTIEDETGTANAVIFPNLFAEFRKPVLQSKLIMIIGKVQKESGVIHVVAQACYDFSKLLRKLVEDENQETLFPEARNFR